MRGAIRRAREIDEAGKVGRVLRRKKGVRYFHVV
jgi:hypothetical protein